MHWACPDQATEEHFCLSLLVRMWNASPVQGLVLAEKMAWLQLSLASFDLADYLLALRQTRLATILAAAGFNQTGT